MFLDTYIYIYIYIYIYTYMYIYYRAKDTLIILIRHTPMQTHHKI